MPPLAAPRPWRWQSGAIGRSATCPYSILSRPSDFHPAAREQRGRHNLLFIPPGRDSAIELIEPAEGVEPTTHGLPPAKA